MFTAPRARLASDLAWVSRALPARPVMPVLAGIRLTVTDGTLTMSGLDSDQSAAAVVEVDGDDMDIVVPGRLLADVVKSVSGENVTLNVDGSHLMVTSGRSQFRLPLMPLDQYPSMPAIPPQFGSVSGRVFADAVRQVSAAASADPALPVLSAVYISTDPEKETLTFAATDRYRLATTTIPYYPESGATAEVFLIPAKILADYGKTFADASVVNLHNGGETTVLFGVTGDDRTATTRVLDGTFPEFGRLIPTEFTGEIAVPVADLNAAVRRVALVADSNHTVKVTLAEGELTVTASDGSANGNAAESLDVDYDGDEFTIAFNHGYLTDGLNNLDADTVRIRLVDPAKPALFTVDDDEDPYRYLLMPIRQQR